MFKISLFFAASLLATTLFGVSAPSTSMTPGSAASTFSFMSMGDGQGETANFTTTLNQVATLHPALVIFNGDLEQDGVVPSEMNPMVIAIQNAGLFNQTFLVRGNHDDRASYSAGLSESYFSTAPNIRILPAGVSNYIALDSNSTYLTYSFDYANSRFIGIDYLPPGGSAVITNAQYTFLDQRLTEAESLGLVHAFIFFHAPEYCMESIHCTCTAKNNSLCTQADFINLINKHPIVSATFHGHEHLLGWVHMDNTRVSSLTHPNEEFLTSPAGGYYYTYDPGVPYPARIDYAYSSIDMGSSQGFSAITVNGDSFTFSIYKDGTTAPVWSQTFTNSPMPG